MKIPPNMLEALGTERAGLQLRLRAVGDDHPYADDLRRRIAEVSELLAVQPAAVKERRPARSATEKRPG